MAEVNEAVEEIASELPLGWFWGGWFIGGLIGLGTGYLGTRRYLELKYQKIAEDEIDQMREHFRSRLVAKEAKPAVEELGKRVEELGYTEYSEPAPAPPGSPNTAAIPDEVKNVFEERKLDDDWDWEVEKASRGDGRPYVIHYDERKETDYEEIILTYYAGDDTLCNAEDTIIDDHDRLVGTENLDKFGHGSKDPLVVYIRNDEMSLDFEVIRSNRTYAEEVHGFTHSEQTRGRHRKRVPWDE